MYYDDVDDSMILQYVFSENVCDSSIPPMSLERRPDCDKTWRFAGQSSIERGAYSMVFPAIYGCLHFSVIVCSTASRPIICSCAERDLRFVYHAHIRLYQLPPTVVYLV